MWQKLLVGLIVLAAALYAAWALMPAATRLRLARSISNRARPGRGPGWLRRIGARLEKSARSGGCEDCSSAPSALKPHDETRGRER